MRRRFVEAVKVQPKGKRGLADEAVALIGKLYGIEREHKNVDDAARLLARQDAAGLDAQERAGHGAVVHARILAALDTLRRARRSADRQQPRPECDPFVVGRKAWLFSDTVGGANASAVIYSVLETAKANGLEPYS